MRRPRPPRGCRAIGKKKKQMNKKSFHNYNPFNDTVSNAGKHFRNLPLPVGLAQIHELAMTLTLRTSVSVTKLRSVAGSSECCFVVRRSWGRTSARTPTILSQYPWFSSVLPGEWLNKFVSCIMGPWFKHSLENRLLFRGLLTSHTWVTIEVLTAVTENYCCLLECNAL